MSIIELSLAEHVADVTASLPQAVPAAATDEDADLTLSSSASCKLRANTSPSGRLEVNFGSSAGSPAITYITIHHLKDHRTHIFEILVTQFLTLILQKIDLSKLLSLKILRGFVLRR